MNVRSVLLGWAFAFLAVSADAGTVPVQPPMPPLAAGGAPSLTAAIATPLRPWPSLHQAGSRIADSLRIIPSAAAATGTVTWLQLRGVNARRASGAGDDFFQQMKNDNIKLVRTGVIGGTLVNDDGEIDMNMVALIDKTLEMARKYDMRVVIDPHTFPGFAERYTTRPDDAFWTDESYHRTVIKTWEFLAERYKDAGDVVAGYDLLNEPNTPSLAPVDGPGNWPALAQKLVEAIRRIDTVHPIIVHANGGKQQGFRPSIDGLQYLRPPYFAPADSSNLVYQVHMYQPPTFALKGNGSYPGQIGGNLWDRERLRQTLQPVRDFQQQTNATIYVGEFGPNVKADNGVGYMTDLINIFEEYGWSWSFHTYKGDANHDITANPAMYAAIKQFWARNPTDVVADR